MKILHIIGSLHPAGGGPPKIAAALAAGQAGIGHDVTVVATQQPDSAQVVDHSLEGIPQFNQVKRVNLPVQGHLKLFMSSSSKRTLKQIVASADIVHLHSVWEPVLLLSAHICRKKQVPYYILLNGMLDPWSLSQKTLKKKVALMVAYRRMFEGAAALHLGNTDERQLIAPLNLNVSSEIIPNGVFFEEIDPLPKPGRFYAKHPKLKNQPFILFLSRLHYKKGLDMLAAAFEIVSQHKPNVHLVVAGPDGGAQKDFESRIETAGLTDRVHVVGPIYGPAKYEALVDATCFCLPSRQEGFSVAITEALACSVPVVITEGCHFPEVAEVKAGEVVPLDREAIGQALLRVLDDETLRASMSIAGRQLIEERFTWPKIAEQTLGVYRKALSH